MTRAVRFCPLCGMALGSVRHGHDAGRPACPVGHFIYYDNPAVTAFAFIVRDERFLVLRRAHEPCLDAWDLPGGFIEAGERPDEAVEREIAEETQLEVEHLKVIGAYASTYGPGGKHTIDVGYRCRVVGGNLRISGEKSEALWTTAADCPPLAFEGERRALADLPVTGLSGLPSR